jgi:hypothetical protein
MRVSVSPETRAYPETDPSNTPKLNPSLWLLIPESQHWQQISPDRTRPEPEPVPKSF